MAYRAQSEVEIAQRLVTLAKTISTATIDENARTNIDYSIRRLESVTRQSIDNSRLARSEPAEPAAKPQKKPAKKKR